jgi:hypothetical protein
MRTAIYTIKIKDNNKAEQILNEIDIALIQIERKYPQVKVQI